MGQLHGHGAPGRVRPVLKFGPGRAYTAAGTIVGRAVRARTGTKFSANCHRYSWIHVCVCTNTKFKFGSTNLPTGTVPMGHDGTSTGT
eukprot:SAG31_NODE_1101_length_9905_cov_3.367122_14_plen_88_part_00